MTLRDDLQPCVDAARQQLVDLGLRPYTVTVRTRVWSGGEPGSGTPTDTDLELTPRPRVMNPSPRLVAASPGVYEDGDLLVDKISRDYTEAQLTGRAIADDAEVIWVLDDGTTTREYRAVEAPEKAPRHNFEWRVHLRRMTRKPGR